MKPLLKSLIFALLLFGLSAAPPAQAEDGRLDELLKELDTLIDKGETQNLADPWFLQDLRALSSRYGQTWPVVLFEHQFDARGAQPKAPWEISQGEMRMDWSRGLRSRVEQAAPSRKKSDKEVAAEIIGGILGQALGTKQQSGQGFADPSTPALAIAEVPVSNAFQLQAEISARDLAGVEEGALELGVFQDGNAGYRLVLVPQAAGGTDVSLLAVSSRSTTRVVDGTVFPESITDDQPLTITLSRRADGVMAVSIGDQELFSASDLSFRDAFDGLLIANRGGDYAVKWMTVRGTQ